MRDRLHRIAKALGLTPTDRIRAEKDLRSRVWWLRGCVEGDQPLPRTRNEPTIASALEAAEGWLAPKLDSEAE
jgi:hypothetical protein